MSLYTGMRAILKLWGKLLENMKLILQLLLDIELRRSRKGQVSIPSHSEKLALVFGLMTD